MSDSAPNVPMSDAEETELLRLLEVAVQAQNSAPRLAELVARYQAVDTLLVDALLHTPEEGAAHEPV
jgi:hypothetical protein